MTKYKCSVCGEKHDRMHISIECSDCYFKGCKIELDKQRKQFLKVIEKLKERLYILTTDYRIPKEIDKIMSEFK